ncbi:hypothetical protein JOD62_001928 [Microbacterium keratanolyticum]|uniref:Carboxylesterase n=1 Tax=Microbacterium keratanolyticum TaxID=67574 RepID=A0A9W6M8P4_9MICO|nr:DUF1214 domain-containing protein [Microbacterium keratanolyticum]MBM7469380.1 hypothetical protein [Microbacterium keratanolyticum]GLK01461.1 hypothetical protein GCM10017596_11760 [Microbacterium keratanolyticum]
MTTAPIPVTFANFVRAESDRMFAGIAAAAPAPNTWNHYFSPTPVDQQTVIRMNRDTLYSAIILDVSRGATITIPDAGDRYVSVMLVSQDHYIPRVLHSGGTYELTAEEVGSDFVLAAGRILVDPENPDDIATVNELQRQFAATSAGGTIFTPTVWEETSFTATRAALIELAKGLGGMEGCFGRKEDVDPIRHLLGTASAWGGLPVEEASYINVNPELPVGEYELVVGDVPVDGFWSITLYNAEGYLEPNSTNAYSINNITAAHNEDGTVTVRFGGDPHRPNTLPIMEGWNYLVRLYRPRPEILDGSWTFPTIGGR